MTESDPNVVAKSIVDQATEEEGDGRSAAASGGESKNPHAVALGRIGGRKGGLARARKLTPEERSEIARKAARARWHGKETAP